jgi:carboxyl-terminal processing protease
MNRSIKIVVIALSLMVFSYAALGYVLGRTDDEKSYRSLTVYSEVLQKIQEDYVEEPSIPKVTVGALHGLLESLDAMSSYMSAQEYSEYQKQLAAHPQGQVGTVLSKRFGYVMVISTLPGSPAEKAGLLPGDLMVSIAGLTTQEMSAQQAEMLLTGAPGSIVKIAVVSRGRAPTETQEEQITRAPLPSVHIVLTKISPDIAYLRIPSLDAGKADELRSKLVDLDHEGIRKVILDVRGCALGSVPEGIAAAQLFLESGNIASLSGQTVTKQEFAADATKVVWKHSVAVLTSGATSGAAEVLAAAIAGNKRGDVVGERTFGSASQQKLIQLDDGAAVNITVAYYYTPAGKAIPAEGSTPTAEVTNPTDDPVQYGHAENPPVTPGDPQKDLVLGKAIELLNGTHKVAETHAPERRTHVRWSLPA